MLALRHVSLACPMLLLSVIACDRSQLTAPSLEVSATSAGGPTVKAPSSTGSSAVSPSQIDVSWQDNSSNETGFEVHRSTTGPSGTFALRASTGANITTYADAGLASSTPYCYKVRAFRTYDSKTSYSDFSNTACATTPTPPVPTAPSGTNAVPSNSSTVDVTWTDNSANEDGFRVERSLDGGSSWATVSTTVANVTSLRDGGRTSEQQVCYRVIAFNAGGESPPSNTDCTTPPAAPTGLTATGLDGPAIDLAWTDNSAVEDGYEVRRSTDGVTFSAVATVASNMTTYRDSRLSENTTYWYLVSAKKDGGFSDPSGVASARAGALTPTLPAAPIGLRAESGMALNPYTIFLYWSAGSGNANGFKIERCYGTEIDCSDADFTLIATLIATTGAQEYSYSDFPVGGGTYRVRAFNRAGDSAWSNWAWAEACDWGGCL